MKTKLELRQEIAVLQNELKELENPFKFGDRVIAWDQDDHSRNILMVCLFTMTVVPLEQ